MILVGVLLLLPGVFPFRTRNRKSRSGTSLVSLKPTPIYQPILAVAGLVSGILLPQWSRTNSAGKIVT
jgi:hypothetical protein